MAAKRYVNKERRVRTCCDVVDQMGCSSDYILPKMYLIMAPTIAMLLLLDRIQI